LVSEALEWCGKTHGFTALLGTNHSCRPHQKKGYVGVSENSVPLFTQFLLIIIPNLNGYFIGNIPYFQTNPCANKKTAGQSESQPKRFLNFAISSEV